MNPTSEFYGLFQKIYDFFNKELFEEALPQCMIVITRKNHTFGYYSPERWINNTLVKADEFAINPIYFDKTSIMELLQTVVHEQVHVWQQHFGSPSRRGYHNKEWAEKMVQIGLMPSDTGQPGGKTTGYQMMDYAIEEGRFITVCREIIKKDGLKDLWYDKITEENKIEMDDTSLNADDASNIKIVKQINDAKNIAPVVHPVNDSKSKIKYQCPKCKSKVWGKKDLSIICGYCEEYFIEIKKILS